MNTPIVPTPTDAMPAVEVLSAEQTYPNGTQALLPVDLRIAEGEFVTLLGPSGCGKSTLLKMVAGMLAPTDGRILLWRKPVQEFEASGRHLSFVFQEATLMPWANVQRNVALPLELSGTAPKEIDERVAESLELVGLSKFAQARPRELSGGMQMRVSIARGLVTKPNLLLMDEPFGALDPVTRHSLQLEMKRVHQVSGKTIVLVTHDIDEALMLATQIVLLDHGQIVQVASPLELLSNPANDFVRDFIGRSDLGIKLLSLKTADALARREDKVEGPTLPGTTSLREALSLMTVAQTGQVNLADAQGAHLGVLHAADVFAPAGAVPA